MKKFLALLVVIIITISACEKDDFCTQNPVTPNLVLRFYNKDTTNDLKKASRLSAIAVGKKDSLFTQQTTDSIAIPLNSLSSKTTYTFVSTNESNVRQTATLTINYTPKEEFVSRSCGYRIIFNNVTLTNTGWIDNLSTNSITTINNQNNAHVNVYH